MNGKETKRKTRQVRYKKGNEGNVKENGCELRVGQLMELRENQRIKEMRKRNQKKKKNFIFSLFTNIKYDL